LKCETQAEDLDMTSEDDSDFEVEDDGGVG
jgi:hypothetical protein